MVAVLPALHLRRICSQLPASQSPRDRSRRGRTARSPRLRLISLIPQNGGRELPLQFRDFALAQNFSPKDMTDRKCPVSRKTPVLWVKMQSVSQLIRLTPVSRQRCGPGERLRPAQRQSAIVARFPVPTRPAIVAVTRPRCSTRGPMAVLGSSRQTRK
jgi:hypothetical protein